MPKLLKLLDVGRGVVVFMKEWISENSGLIKGIGLTILAIGALIAAWVAIHNPIIVVGGSIIGLAAILNHFGVDVKEFVNNMIRAFVWMGKQVGII